MNSWKLPAVLALLEVLLLFVFRNTSINSYLLIWGLIFGFFVMVQYTGLGFRTFGQGYINHKIHRKEIYDVTYGNVKNISDEKQELVIAFEDILMVGAALINLGLSWFL